MIDIRGVKGDISHHITSAEVQAGTATALSAKREKTKKELDDLNGKKVRKRLEKEYGRFIDDPAEREILDRLADEIKNNADKFV